MDKKDYEYVYTEFRKVYPQLQLKAPIPLPDDAFNRTRNRYRADSLIRYLRDRTPGKSVTIGLTGRDISTTKGEIHDWGVMGLGYRPGKACIASSYRLNPGQKQQQFFKVAIHEIGHTQGLHHCPVSTCYMRDAEGGNPTAAETGFCPSCKAHLTKKGWGL
ncbi:matrixin family metalloprotease [Flavihumibacter rivuli]|uniref:matrixin family metalloprotease n=1 Tax=Flavihumibacter rivuli TaxID=2838156 RepID=UPI001BDF36D2|nr:matrixin family metalloprotease [Flavihumibacter rivuli]ULQ57110.1 matrixin family metalloprotease [Flavihumibacter rivuli]